MGVKRKTETRLCFGTVSISPYKNGQRLRWRYGNTRPEIYVPASHPNALLIANKIKKVIEQDLVSRNYDEDLKRYKELLKQAALRELMDEQLITSPVYGKTGPYQADNLSPEGILKEFDRYLVIKDKVNDTNYYALTRKALVKWGAYELDDIPALLSKEKWSPKTFNDRRNCLNAFFEWMKRKKKIKDNPLEDLSTKERDRMHEDREPFTDREASEILEALRTDRFVKKSARYNHSQYFPFVAFLLHIGCRPGEAIGLKVRFVKFDEGHLTIGNSLARTLKGSHAAAREYKSTKNMKVRHIPLDDFLVSLLKPLCKGRSSEDYVFVNVNGNPIDDKMFLRRVFKPIQKELNIPYRVLYACRHTFATRAVKQGIKPHEVAYLMGDTVETVLSNYFHNNCMPSHLPRGIPLSGHFGMSKAS